MKRITLIISIFFLYSLPVNAESDLRFLNALRSCSPYDSNGAIEVQGVNADYRTMIVGWDNDKCVYKKYLNLQGLSICTVCRFGKSHINQIVRTMETYKTGYDEYGNEVDINDVETMKNTPVVKLWNQYLTDPNLCNVEF